MRESLFSPLWYRYSQQKPQIKTHVRTQQQKYRNQTWHLLINTNNESHFRISSIAYEFVGRCNGEFTVQEIWDNLLENLQDHAPTQDEIIRLLNELDQKDLLFYDATPHMPSMFRRTRDKNKQQRQSFLNPFALRVPLWDPSKFLDRTERLTQAVFNPLTLLIWGVIVLIGVASASSHWAELYAHAKSYMDTPRYLLLAWISFPIIKAVHEFGHALAVKHWGGDVQETGVTFFMLTPAPYVDASASNAFPKRYQRAVVSAIGIMVELFLASIALFIFFSVQSGLVKDIAFVTAFICSVSTLLFNGNPLLRFDAYYALTDVLDLPNLASRSRTYWSNKISGVIIGKENSPTFDLATGEEKWLLLYSPLSIFYSLIIFFSIILWLGGKSLAIGMLGALFVLWMFILKPLYGIYDKTLMLAPVGIARLKVKSLMLASLAGIAAILFVIPAPNNTNADGIVWIPDHAHIRSDTDGFVKTFLAKNNEIVTAGQVLAVLENHDLIAKDEQLHSQLTKIKTAQFYAMFHDPEKMGAFIEQEKNILAEIKRNAEKVHALQIRSTVGGRLIWPRQDDMVGSYVKQGELLGYVLDRKSVNVRVALQAPDIALVRERITDIEVKTADHINDAVHANLVMITPAVTNSLPSAALGDKGGGNYMTDPTDKEGLTLVEPIVLVDVNMPSATFERAGTRASVRFNHGNEPIAKQFYRSVKVLFLRYFTPTN